MRGKKPAEKPVPSDGKMFKAVFLGSCPVDDGYGSDKIRAAVGTIQTLDETPRKVWVTITDKSLILSGRVTHDTIAEIPLLSIITSCYVPDEARPEGISGTMYGFTEFTEELRLHTVYVLTFKSSVRVTCPTVLRENCDTAFQLFQKMSHYDAYLTRAKDDATDDTDSKTGEVLGRFSAKYLGSAPIPDGDGVGPAAVNGAIQLLRAKLAQLYASDRKRKRKKNLAGDNVVLAVSSEGIHTTEALSNEDLGSVFIENIVYTSVTETDDPNQKKMEIFAYVSEDERLNRTACHIYDMPRGKAREICLMIGAAFQVAEQENEAENPFAAVSSSMSSDPLPGLLSDAILNRRRLTAVKVIGTGQFGLVYLANIAETVQAVGSGDEKMCAVKMLRAGANPANKAEFLREASIMCDLKHPNVCSILGVSIQQRPWLAVLEYVQYGDLREVLRALKDKKIDLSTAEIVTLATHISGAMIYVVSKRYCHRDLASRNCLLGENNVVQLADFGLSQPFDEGKNYYLMRKGARLPMKWTDPGGVKDKKFGEWTDVWSFGVTLWELFSHAAVPYTEVPNTEIQRRLNEGLRLSQPDLCPDDIYDIMRSCWSPVSERLKFWEIDAKLRAKLKSEVDRGVGIRDIGATLNNQYSALVRRMTRTASVMQHRRKSTKFRTDTNPEEDTGILGAAARARSAARGRSEPSSPDTDVPTNAHEAVPTISVDEENEATAGAKSEDIDLDDVLGRRRARTRSAVFEELHISTDDTGSRLRMRSVSLTRTRPQTVHDAVTQLEDTGIATSSSTDETLPEVEAVSSDPVLTETEVEVDMSSLNKEHLSPVVMPLPSEGLQTHIDIGKGDGDGCIVVETIETDGQMDGSQGRVRSVSLGRHPEGRKVTVQKEPAHPSPTDAASPPEITTGDVDRVSPSSHLDNTVLSNSPTVPTPRSDGQCAPPEASPIAEIGVDEPLSLSTPSPAELDTRNADTTATGAGTGSAVVNPTQEELARRTESVLRKKKKVPPPVKKRSVRPKNEQAVEGTLVTPESPVGGVSPPTPTPSPRTATDDALYDSDSEDDIDPEALPELDQLGVAFDVSERRRQHEEAERIRQIELRDAHTAKVKAEQEALADFHAKVELEKEAERAALEAEKEAALVASEQRASELRFSFSFSDERRSTAGDRSSKV